TIAPPLGLDAPVRRELPAARPDRELLNENLGPPERVRRVGYPVGIRRKTSVCLVRRGSEQGLWLVLAGQIEIPDILARLRIRRFVEHEASINRPVVKNRGRRRTKEHLLSSTRGDRLHVECGQLARPSTDEEDALAVRRPEWICRVQPL